jgi:hypothetical protein
MATGGLRNRRLVIRIHSGVLAKRCELGRMEARNPVIFRGFFSTPGHLTRDHERMRISLNRKEHCALRFPTPIHHSVRSTAAGAVLDRPDCRLPASEPAGGVNGDSGHFDAVAAFRRVDARFLPEVGFFGFETVDFFRLPFRDNPFASGRNASLSVASISAFKLVARASAVLASSRWSSGASRNTNCPEYGFSGLSPRLAQKSR